MRGNPFRRRLRGARARDGADRKFVVVIFASLLGVTAFCTAVGGASATEPEASPIAKAFGESYSARIPDPFPPEALVSTGRGTASTSKPDKIPGSEGACPILLDFRMEDLRGRRIDLCAFKGKVLLIVNTASFCGYTPQYRGLEALQERYAAAGLVVLGFPSNDFGAQEPGSSAEIQDFCEATYGVRFPMFGKVTLRGMGKPPLFDQLTNQAAPPSGSGEIAWNFEKFLLDRDGKLVARFRSAVEPEAPDVLAFLRAALGSS
jgi:glutathione peroxidase